VALATHEIFGFFALALGLVAAVSIFRSPTTASDLSATFAGVSGLQSNIANAGVGSAVAA